MTSRTLSLIAAMLMLAACSKGANQAGPPAAMLAGSQPTPPGSDQGQPAADTDKAAKVSLPQIAYSYDYTFRLPERAMDAVEDRHVALCDRLGPSRCHVLNMQRATDGGGGGGSLKLEVAASLARPFGRALAEAAAQAGGTEADSSITAEDLSKTIVDTQAHLRAKQALADRLTELLKTRNGSVADLVAAERALSDVQEEIDAANSELAEAQGRVAMSTVEISYQTGAAAGGIVGPVRASFGQVGTLLGGSLAALIQFGALALPWLVLVGLLVAGWRVWRRRRRRVEQE